MLLSRVLSCDAVFLTVFGVYVVCVSHLCFPDRRSLYTRCLLDRAECGVIGQSGVGWGGRRDREGDTLHATCTKSPVYYVRLYNLIQ